MGGNSREGTRWTKTSKAYAQTYFESLLPGGKAKPLKAPKKEKKDLDEDEVAYREKQKTGGPSQLFADEVIG